MGDDLHLVSFFADLTSPFPDTWSPIAGDIFHNLRSALDHLAWQLVRSNGSRRSARIEFPIALTPLQWEKAKKKIEGAKPEHIAVVRSYQPFRANPDWPWRGASDPIDSPMALLAALNVIDKHRGQNPIAPVLAGGEILSVNAEDVACYQRTLGGSRPPGSRVHLASYEVVPIGPNPSIGITCQDLQLSIQILAPRRAAVGQTGRWFPFFQLARLMAREVEMLLDDFRDLIPHEDHPELFFSMLPGKEEDPKICSPW